MKHLKKFIASLLTICLILGTSTTAFASEPVQILANNDNECVVREITDDGITVATNNKQTGILTIEKYDSTGTTLLSTETLDLNAIAEEAELSEQNGSQTLSDYTHVYQHTFSNREYDCYIYTSYTRWKLRSGDSYKTLYEYSTNASAIENFRSAVESVNSAELALISVVGGTAVVTIVSALLSGGTAAAIAAAGGVSGASAAIFVLNSAINNADYYFARL